MERRDYRAVSCFLSPKIELHMFPDAPEERVLDVEPVYRGHDGYAKAGEFFQSDFDNIRWELRELYDPGGNRIGGRVDRSGRGAHSGITVHDTDFYVWQVERGFLRRQWIFQGKPAMLALLHGEELAKSDSEANVR
jgi:hypothetical protein